MDKVYIKPYCRIAPYLVGVALGYLIHIEKSAPRQSPLVSRQRESVLIDKWFLDASVSSGYLVGSAFVVSMGCVTTNETPKHSLPIVFQMCGPIS